MKKTKEKTKGRTNLWRIAAIATLSMLATFAAAPAQAKFGVMGGYKYISIPNNNVNYTAHVFQMDILSTLGKEYRTGTKRPRHALGLALAGGGGSTVNGGSVYFAIPFIYEYVFPIGLGISAGVSVPFYFSIGSDAQEPSFLTGISLSDIGLNYHFKKGWTLYARGNVGSATAVLGDLDDTYLAWGVGLGGGYWF